MYMPGLVKTKILKNEPQPMRLFVQIMNIIMGLTPQKAAENIYKVIQKITLENLKNKTFSYSKIRKRIKLETKVGDTEKLINLTENLISKFK